MTIQKKVLVIAVGAILISGCQTLNSRVGRDSMDYSQAREMPPLKFPPESLAVSKRYDIPKIPNEDAPIITEIKPPNL